MKKLLLIFIYFLFTSCVTNYYLVSMEEDTPIYESSSENSKQVVVIPKGNSVYVASSTKKHKKIKWNNYKGWVVNPVFSSPTNYNSAKSSSTSSYYSNSSSKSSSGGTVHVKAYTRKDGTYVKAHTRSAPKRK